MADLFNPVPHVDGELFDATDLNRLEQGLESLDVAVDQLVDQVDALAAGGSNGQVLSGPRSSFSPAIGTILLDTSLTPPRYIGGYGTEWRELNGTVITSAGGGGGTPEPGTSGAPVLTSEVTAGGTIGAINLTWTAVAGATSYKVYETESPAGVTGATALTTTSSTRTPSTARNYRYWVTATVNGVESASSNVIEALLPFVAGGGTPPDPGTGGTGSNPSTFLNINGLGNGTGGWWNLGIGFSTGHTDIAPDALKTYVNSPYYTMNSTGNGVQFQIFMNGGKTSANTKYPRSELREYATGSTTTKAAWSGSSGRHIMRGKTKVMHFAPEKPEVCVAQAHDASDDILMLHVTGASATGAQTWRIKVKGVTVATPLTNVALGQEVSWDFDINNGALTVKINGSTAYTGNPGYGAGCYFKVGEYAQQNSTDQANSASEYGRCELRDLFVSHS